MRSKTAVWAYLIILSLSTILSLYIPKNEVVAKESIVIPGVAIRLRILANSDTEADQALKRKVRDAVNAQITLWVQDLTSMEKAKTLINEKLPEIKKIAERVVRDNGSDQSVKTEFGQVQFPTKLYGQFLYPAGKYQAVLITLGEGKGANWWCVLFPPLCFLDFSNGVAVSDGFEQKAEPVAVEKEVIETTAPVPMEKEVSVAEPVEHKYDSVGKVESKHTPEEKEESKSGHVKKASKTVEHQKPVYTPEDEQPVKVKFFVVEMFQRLFN